MPRLLLALCCWAASLVLPTWHLRPSPLRIHMLDVGQGDALLIETPHGRRILIDGGPDRSVVSALARTLPAGARTLDLAVLTHPHADHLEGLVSILDLWRVERVMLTGEVVRTDSVPAFLSTLRTRGTAPTLLLDRSAALVDGVRLTFLVPGGALIGAVTPNANTGSVVVVLEYGATRALFLGDLEAKGERALLQSGVLGPVTILKAGHHGSRTSTTEALLQKTAPAFTLLSVGAKNRYRHPSDDVLERLADASTTVLRTDLHGTVSLVCANGCCSVEGRGDAENTRKCIPP